MAAKSDVDSPLECDTDKNRSTATANGEGTPQGWGPHTPAGDSAEQKGAPSSNTAPSNCNGASGTSLLRVGVDSLYLSYHGDLSSGMAIRLKTLKELAQSKDPDRVRLAQISIGDHLFEVRDRGRFPYEFILVDGWYRIEIAGLRAERAPMAYVVVRSEPLTFEGPKRVEEDLREVISTLGLVEGPPSVSHVDLCADFVTDFDISTIQERDWVTRARKFAQYSENRQFSGWSVAQGNPLSARLYNKLLELAKSGKDYYRQIWSDCGWDGLQNVWRLEFQYRREVLRQLGVTSFDDLITLMGGLWRYSSSEWLRLTSPDPTDKTQSRWPTHPVWAVLQEANWGVEQGVSRIVTPTGQPPSDTSLFINGISGLTSFMAREGYTDAYEAAPAFFLAARDFHDAREHFTGLSFDEYIAQKVALKARQFNSIQNEPPVGDTHPADRAVADEYRRRSDGE